MANARRTRRRRIEPSRRPLASSSSLTPKDLLRRLLAGLLVVPGRAVAGYRRLEARAFGLGLGKVCRPAAATVAVGGMSPDCRGRVMLTSWLLGWAASRGVST
ncbi:MAG TPA: tetraacyldisaccharide 4'-kinase, partial [Solidesulfovibrio magneticus]|nr:tetraacyldisaccharide 4'-kinase [Solidesulfovibrio magneticus]